MDVLQYAKEAGIARINRDYENALKAGVEIPLSNGEKFSVSTKASLHDYEIVRDGFKEGMFVIDRQGRRLYDLNLITEVCNLMSEWGIQAFNKRVELQQDIREATTLEEIINVIW